MRSRPKSYNLTMSLFNEAGLPPKIVQQAEGKHTIINMVGSGKPGFVRLGVVVNHKQQPILALRVQLPAQSITV